MDDHASRPRDPGRSVCEMTTPRVQFGELLNVFGRPAEYDGMKFVPAAVRIEESTRSTEQHFRDHPEFKRANTIPYYDVAFIRARIPRVFGYTPQPAEGEKTFLYEGFLAVNRDAECIPFNCTDFNGRTGLEFGKLVPDDVKGGIASRLWALFLADSDDVEDFEFRVEQYGFHPLVTLGCRNGEVYAEED
jgi:hypothetical protein